MSRICKRCFLLIFLVLMKRTESHSLPQGNEDQPNKLTENILKLHTLLSEILAENNEEYYDEHFNCINNCSIPTCLSSSYPKTSIPNSIPQSCAEATATNEYNNGVYLLKLPDEGSKPFYAYCDHEDGKGSAWTVIQRRDDDSVNFNRNWLDYKNGFGDLYGEYWIGLERIHAMTKARPHALWISLNDKNKDYSYVKYLNFSVANEDEGYKLTLEDSEMGNAGGYFRPNNNEKFSTFDRDNDSSYLNCARILKGGWWFKDCNCCSLNGYFHSLKNKNYGEREWTNENTVLLENIQMAIRPI